MVIKTMNAKFRPISTLSDDEKFNRFTREAEEEFSENAEFSKSIPRLILKMFFNASKEDIENALKGLGSNDHGLDAFWIDHHEKKYYFIQFKTRKHYNSKDNKDAKKEWFSLLNELNGKMSGNLLFKNSRLKSIKEDFFSLEKYSCEKIIFHLGNCSEEILNCYSDIRYYNQNDILEKYRLYHEEYLDGEEVIPESLTLAIQNYSNRTDNRTDFIYFTPRAIQGNSRETCIFPISGNQVVQDLLKQGTTILDRNVRGFLGAEQKINKEMIETAINNPESFYYYNNGITITCDNIKAESLRGNPKFTLTKPQIINGAQTVNSLYDAYRKLIKIYSKMKDDNPTKSAQDHMSKITVMCRVIQGNKGNDTNLTKNITRFNNTQNKVKLTDFFSNKKEQNRLKEILLNYDIDYNIKRGKQFEHRNRDNIDLNDMAEHYYAQNFEPYYAKSSIIFENSEEKDSIYNKIFGEDFSYIKANELSYVKTYYVYKKSQSILKILNKNLSEIESFYNKNQKDNDISNFLEYLHKNKFFQYLGNRKEIEKFLRKEETTFSVNIIGKIDSKILGYIINQFILYSYMKVLNNDDNKDYKISTILNQLIINKHLDFIETLLEEIVKQALEVYLDFMSINTSSTSKIDRKTKEKQTDFTLFVNKKIDRISDKNYIRMHVPETILNHINKKDQI